MQPTETTSNVTSTASSDSTTPNKTKPAGGTTASKTSGATKRVSTAPGSAPTPRRAPKKPYEPRSAKLTQQALDKLKEDNKMLDKALEEVSSSDTVIPSATGVAGIAGATGGVAGVVSPASAEETIVPDTASTLTPPAYDPAEVRVKDTRVEETDYSYADAELASINSNSSSRAVSARDIKTNEGFNFVDILRFIDITNSLEKPSTNAAVREWTDRIYNVLGQLDQVIGKLRDRGINPKMIPGVSGKVRTSAQNLVSKMSAVHQSTVLNTHENLKWFLSN